MKGIRKFKILTITLTVCIVCLSGIVFAANSVELNRISDKITTDIHKIWTVRFNKPVDLDSLANNIQVKDLKDGSTVGVSISQGSDDKTVKVIPPSKGYTVGHDYEITVNDGIKSKIGKFLKRKAAMAFKVRDTSTVSYTATAKVVVSPMLPMFKQITISSTDNTDIKKYKIDGNKNIMNIGGSIASMVAGDNVTVSFYGSDGTTVIATATLSVSESKDNLTLKLTNK